MSVDATLHVVSSYGLRNNVTMNKNASNYCHESNIAFSQVGNSNNIVWSVDVKNHMNSSGMGAWFI